MAANTRSTWRLLAALLLLVTVPAAGWALPPPAPKADLVSAELLDDVAGFEQAEILVLVAVVVPEELPSWADPHRKTRVWGSNLTSETQPIGKTWFKGEIAVGVLVVRFYHADGLGSVRALTDETGTVADRYSFTAFGELLEHVGDDENAYLFAGEPLDPSSGFYYNRARWMDPGVGRFVSVDPFGGVVQDPMSLHRYLYAASDPLGQVDPSGLFTIGGALTSFTLGAATFLSVFSTAGIERALGPIAVRLRPVVAVDSGWEFAEVQDALILAQKTFQSQTRILLQWSSIEMNSPLVPTSVRTDEAPSLLRALYWDDPSVVTIGFLDLITPGDALGLSFAPPAFRERSALVARRYWHGGGGLAPTDRRTAAHELGHAVGSLPNRSFGKSNLLFEFPGGGTDLDDGQVEQAEKFARRRF